MFVIVSGRTDFVSAWHAALMESDPASGVTAISHTANLSSFGIARPIRLIVLDLDDIEGDRTPMLKRWKTEFSGIPLIAAGTEFSPEREMAALALGMSACCDQRLPANGLAHIINVVMGGGVWISGLTFPQLMGRLAAMGGGRKNDSSDSPQAVGEGLPGWNLLTDRQKAVALLIADGENNKLIARKLDIADRTVKAHLSAVFEKLHVTDRTQLAVLLNRYRPSLNTNA